MANRIVNGRTRTPRERSGDVSSATVARLPRYLRAVLDEAASGTATVSSERIAEVSDVNPATVRRDLSTLNLHGIRGLGYDVKYLVEQLTQVLGASEAWPVALVGAGNLGRALANHRGLPDRGFPVRAILDIDPELVGARVGELRVEHLDDLAGIVKDRGIGVGVIATPAEGAQFVADAMVAAGLRSIMNFTALPLDVPEDVETRRVDLATELQILSFYQRRRDSTRRGSGVPLAHGAE